VSGDAPALPTDLPAELLRACYADAVRKYPYEACGLLSGPAGCTSVDALRVCENDQARLHASDPSAYPETARTAYRLRFVDVRWLVESLESAQPVKVIYHSHVEVGPELSTADQQAALHEGQPIYPVAQLVIAVGRRGVFGAKLYGFMGHGFECWAEFDEQGQQILDSLQNRG
jgi:adenylyltransferase/sulfurtransferase